MATLQNLSGVYAALRAPDPWDKQRPEDEALQPSLNEIEDDLDGEQEAYTEGNEDDSADLPPESDDEAGGEDEEEEHLMRQCDEFMTQKGFIEQGNTFFTATPPKDAPLLIIAWIMHHCDDVNLDGTAKPLTVQRDSYSHAQKMRATATYAFGRVAGLGSLPWQRSELSGRMVGNPSVSESVSRYMVTLRKKKVRAGEVATSARAITPEILEQLYHHNNQPGVGDIKPIVRTKRANKNRNDWGGGRMRRLLQAVYVISYLCLLRFDEALKIQIHDIRRLNEHSYELTLPFRKTSQYGDIKPFVLHEMPEQDAHLCPVRALSSWLHCSQITDQYLFPNVTMRDQISDSKTPMKSDRFLELFRNNLLDIGRDPYPYGTHSFRRGGCQYFATYRRWSLRKICEWGGWSMDFSHLTIVKYLIGWNDDPTQLREDFLNPNLQMSRKCHVCGRSCDCWQ
ncbi:DNA breaking-rejoining enzyme [Mycena kentingensis (nom. inval.)]|nr:DNA breaking-rejoining enzyme [Mycena kentingensis (nom. inval.)]